MNETEPKVPINILLVDDRSDGMLVLEAILQGQGYNLFKASSGEEGLRCFLRDDFAVVLLDVLMPGMDGFQTARRMHTSPQRSELFAAMQSRGTRVAPPRREKFASLIHDLFV